MVNIYALVGYGIYGSLVHPKDPSARSAWNWTATGQLIRGVPNDFTTAHQADAFSTGLLLNQYNAVRSRINRKFILVVTLNENWGFLSGSFPGRTARWGKCCDQYKILPKLLDDDNVLMVVLNQRNIYPI